MNNLVKHINIRVTGQVHGVFFRSNAQTMAQKHGIRGFVRNDPDGSVYIEAEGGREDLQAFIAWCENGPDLAHVNSCEVSEGPIQNYQDFIIA